MTEFTTIPEGWSELEYEVGESLTGRPHTEEFDATWASDDEQIVVTVRHTEDGDGRVSYPVVVEQTLSDGEVETDVQSHARVEDDRKQAERVAADFMEEVEEGQHTLRLLGVERSEQFYQFYCISDSELPDDLTGDDLIGSIDDEKYEDELHDVPDDYDESEIDRTIKVSIFPRHRAEIETDE